MMYTRIPDCCNIKFLINVRHCNSTGNYTRQLSIDAWAAMIWLADGVAYERGSKRGKCARDLFPLLHPTTRICRLTGFSHMSVCEQCGTFSYHILTPSKQSEWRRGWVLGRLEGDRVRSEMFNAASWTLLKAIHLVEGTVLVRQILISWVSIDFVLGPKYWYNNC